MERGLKIDTIILPLQLLGNRVYMGYNVEITIFFICYYGNGCGGGAGAGPIFIGRN